MASGTSLPPCGAIEGARDEAGRSVKLAREQRASQGTCGPDFLRGLRECWRCPCDGRSHKATKSIGGPQQAVDAMAAHIEELSGHRPTACPWRAMYEPLVARVVEVATLATEGIDSTTDEDPALLFEALRVYYRARVATQIHDAKLRQKQEEAKRKTLNRRG